MRVDPVDGDEVLEVGGKRIGYGRATRRRHDRKPTGKIAHLWWYRCLERAGLVLEGATSGVNMHRGRHTAATELQGAHHHLRLTQLLLGHSDIRSTARYAYRPRLLQCRRCKRVLGWRASCGWPGRWRGKSLNDTAAVPA